MSFNDTPSSERVHISFFGKRNAGKSSLVNAITGQTLSVVSDVLGTTTDPVKKTMELLPIGPVVITDTAGFDDRGNLGTLRVEKTHQVLAKTDIAIFVKDATKDHDEDEVKFLSEIKEKNLPHVIVHNKADLLESIPDATSNEIWVSATKGINVNQLKEMIGRLSFKKENPRRIVGDLLTEGDIVVLVTPIDESAPKGRIILPQQQTIRDILDSHCTVIMCQDTELSATLSSLATCPKMIITDSQVFGKVAKIVPDNIPLTSFSILFARYKGDLKTLVSGASHLAALKSGDKILISEGCTHHRQCGDIGTVKFPKWISDFCGSQIDFDFTSGGEFPANLSQYKLVVHCGGCMLNEAEMTHRISVAERENVPIVNYGIAIAHTKGVLKRSLELFPDVYKLI